MLEGLNQGKSWIHFARLSDFFVLFFWLNVMVRNHWLQAAAGSRMVGSCVTVTYT